MLNETWIDTIQLAELFGVSRQAAHKGVRRALPGAVWKRETLRVRYVSGNVGQGGIRYEVALSSLSEDRQARFRGTLPALPLFPTRPDPTPYVPRALAQEKRQAEQFALIEPAVYWGITPAERTAAIRAIVAASGKGENTIRRYIRAYERGGYNALGRALPKDADKPRCAVSRIFDRAFRAAGGSAEQLAELSDYVDGQIKGLWKSREADAGAKDLGECAEFTLLERCEALGLPITRKMCVIGRRRVEKWRYYSKVNLMRTDAKAFHDEAPRIARDWTAFAPMECVVADVKHLDVRVTRADGTTAYPKLIGFMDAGTGRIFPYLVLCEQRRSITQELVIEAFCAMANDPLWGLPSMLYLYDGSEFGGLDKIKPALSLIKDSNGREIIRARPYNAAAKPIEPLFARLDRYCFSSIPGYTGGNRMVKRTQNIGREAEAYKNTWEEFKADVLSLIAYYHQRIVGGQWSASPNDVFRAKIADGWRPIMPDALALETAFCTFVERKRTKQGIRTDRGRFMHPELRLVPIGTPVRLAIPYRKDAAPVVFLPNIGPVQLMPDTAYPAHSVDGAVESGRRQQAYRKTIAQLAGDGPTIDPVALKRRIAERVEPIVIPGRRTVLDHGAEIHELAATRVIAEQRAVSTVDEAERRRAHAMRVTERLERQQRHGS